MTEKSKIIISNIGQEEINIKGNGEMLSRVINEACREENIPMTNHKNINPKRHLNQSKFHFNNYGNSVFVKNIRNVLSNLIWRDGRDNSDDYVQICPSLKVLLQSSIVISKSSNVFENNLNKMKRKRLEYLILWLLVIWTSTL